MNFLFPLEGICLSFVIIPKIGRWHQRLSGPMLFQTQTKIENFNQDLSWKNILPFHKLELWLVEYAHPSLLSTIGHKDLDLTFTFFKISDL